MNQGIFRGGYILLVLMVFWAFWQMCQYFVFGRSTNGALMELWAIQCFQVIQEEWVGGFETWLQNKFHQFCAIAATFVHQES